MTAEHMLRHKKDGPLPHVCYENAGFFSSFDHVQLTFVHNTDLQEFSKHSTKQSPVALVVLFHELNVSHLLRVVDISSPPLMPREFSTMSKESKIVIVS